MSHASQYRSDKQKMFYTSPLNPPTLGDFQIRTPQGWGAGGPSAIMLKLIEQYCHASPALPYLRKTIATGFLLTCASILSTFPIHAAQRLTVRYGAFEQGIQVADLHRYAETQQASPALAGMLQYLDADAKKGLQPLLQARYPVNVAVLDKVLDTKVGQAFLTQAAETITPAEPANRQALRSALIVGSAPPGLSVLSMLDAYPNAKLTVDLSKAMALVKQAMPDPPKDQLASVPMWQTIVEYQAMTGVNQTYQACLFGDSISSALGNTLGAGRFNFALGGMSTTSLLVQLDRLVQQQVKCQTVVIAIGTNDAMYSISDEQFQQNLTSIITTTRTVLGAQTIILLPAFYSTVEASNNPRMAGTLPRIDEINKILRVVAKAENVPVYGAIIQPLFEQGALKQNLTIDGVHLNSEGLRIYRQAILSILGPAATPQPKKMSGVRPRQPLFRR
jgi:lysophospholipase L1-like esterase